MGLTSMADISGGLTIRDAGGLATIGALGTGTAGDITVTDSQAGVTFSGAVDANTVTLTDTANGQSVTFAGNTTINTGLLTAAQGYNVAFMGTTNSVAGDTTFSNTGGLTLGNGGDSLTFAGGLDTTAVDIGGGTVNIGGTINTTNTQMDLGAITLTAVSELDTGTAAASRMNVGAVTSGGFGLTLDSGNKGAADMTVVSFAGGGDLTIRDSGGATFSGAVNAGTVTLTDTIGEIAFQDNTAINTGLTTANQSYDISFTGTNNSVAGDTNFLNTGTVTLGNGSGDSITFGGGLDLTGGPSSRSLAGTINTTNTQMDLGAVELTAATTLDTGNGANGILNVGAVTSNGNSLTLDSGSTAGATIGLTSMADISGGLTIRDAGGLATIGAVGTGAPGDITVTDSQAGVTFSGIVNANTVTLTNTTGTISFAGDTTINTELLTAAPGYNVGFTGTTNSVAGDTTFLNTGTVTLGDGLGDSNTFTGGLTVTAPSAINIAGTISTTNTGLTLGDAATETTLTDNATVVSGSGLIQTGAVTDGGSSFTLEAGNVSQTGGVTFTGNMTVNDLDTFGSGYGVTFQGANNTIDTATAFLNTGTVTLGNDSGDSTAFTGGLTVTAPSAINIAGTVSTTDTGLTLGDGNTTTKLTADAALVSGSGLIQTGAVTDGGSNFTLEAGNVTQTGGVTFTENVTVNDLDTFAGAYDVTFQGTNSTIDTATTFLNTGTVTLGNGPGDSTAFTGGLTVTDPSAINIAGTISTTNTGLTLGDANTDTTLTADATLLSGSGLIQTGAVTDGMSSFSLDVGDVTQTGGVTFTGNVTVNDLDTFASGYNVTFQGANSTIDTATAFLNTGMVTFGDGGDSLTFTDGVTHTAGATTAAGTISTTNTDIDIGALTITGITTMSSGTATTTVGAVTGGGNALTLTANEIDFTGSADSVDGVTILIMQPNSTDISIGIGNGAAGALLLDDTDMNAFADGLTSIIIGQASGTHTIDARGAGFTLKDPTLIRAPVSGGNITVNNGLTGTGDASITLNGSAATTLNAGITTAGQDITISDDVIIGDGLTIMMSTGASTAGNIAITGTTNGVGNDGGESLTLISGSGTIILTGAVGDAAKLGTLTLQADDAGATGAVTFNDNVTADAITTFARAYSVSLNEDANITNDTTFLNTNGVSLGNGTDDILTFTGGIDTTAVDAGGGTVNIAGTLITDGTQMDLGSVLLNTAATLDTGNGANGILNVGAVMSNGNSLTLDAGSTSGATMGLTSMADISGGLTIRDSGGLATIGAVGAGTGNITVTDSQAGVTFSGTVNANTVTLTDTANGQSVTFAGDTTINTGLLTAAQGYNVAFTGATNNVAGTTNFLNSGTVMLGDGNTDSTAFTGGVNITAPSVINIAGTISTTNSGLTLGDVDTTTTMTADATLVSGTGLIQTGAVTDGGSSFSLDVGDGSQTGEVRFTGNVTVNDLDTFASGYNVTFQGANSTIDTATAFLNTGTVTLGNGSTDRISFAGGLDLTGGPSSQSLAGTINTTNTQMDLGAVSLTEATTLDTGNGAIGVLNVGPVLSNGNSMTLDSGSTAGATIGLTSMADISGGLTIRDAGSLAMIGALGTVTAGDITVTDSKAGVTFSGTVNANTVTLTGTANGQSVTFADDTTINNGLVTGGQGYNVVFTGTTNSVASDTTFNNTGTVTLGDGSSDSITFVGGLDTNNGPSGTNVAGTVATNNQDLDLNITTLTADTALDSNGGNINFHENVRGDYKLTLTAGSVGNIDFMDRVGSGTPLNGLEIGSAASLEFADTVAIDDEGLAINDIDTVNIYNTVTTSNNGSFAVDDVSTLDIGGNIEAREISITNTPTVELGMEADLIAYDGKIEIWDGVTEIVLKGDQTELSFDDEFGDTVDADWYVGHNTIVAFGDWGDIGDPAQIRLAEIDYETVNNPNLLIQADRDITLETIDVNQGVLKLWFDKNNNESGRLLKANSLIAKLREIRSGGGDDNVYVGTIVTYSDLIFSSDVILTLDTSYEVKSDGGDPNKIEFQGSINSNTSGNWMLSLISEGDTNFLGSIGGDYELGGLRVAAGGTINIDGGALRVVNPKTDQLALPPESPFKNLYGIELQGNVEVGSNLTVSTDSRDINFNGTINSDTVDNWDLNLNSNFGDTYLLGAVGNSMALGSINISSQNIQVNGGLVKAVNNVSLNNATTIGNSITIMSDEIEIADNMDAGVQTVTLTPFNTAQGIVLGGGVGTGALDLTAVELGRINSSSLTIGSNDNTGGMSIVDNVPFSMDISLITGNSNISFDTTGAITATGKTINITTSGGNVVDNTAAMTNITGGDLTITANGSNANIGGNTTPIEMNLTGALTASANNGTGGIYTNNTGNLAVNAVNAGSGDVDMVVTGAITDGSVGDDSNPNIIGATIDLEGYSIGEDGPGDLDVTVSTQLNANTTSGPGGIFIESTGDMLIGDITGGDGYEVSLASGGNITKAGSMITSYNLTLFAVGGIGASGNEIETTTSNNLAATTGGVGSAGDIYILEINDLNTGKVAIDTDSSTQLVSLTSINGTITIGGDIGNENDDITLIALNGNILDGGGTITANDLILMVQADGARIGDPWELNTAGNYIKDSSVPVNIVVGGVLTADASTGNGGVFLKVPEHELPAGVKALRYTDPDTYNTENAPNNLTYTYINAGEEGNIELTVPATGAINGSVLPIAFLKSQPLFENSDYDLWRSGEGTMDNLISGLELMVDAGTVGLTGAPQLDVVDLTFYLRDTGSHPNETIPGSWASLLVVENPFLTGLQGGGGRLDQYPIPISSFPNRLGLVQSGNFLYSPDVDIAIPLSVLSSSTLVVVSPQQEALEELLSSSGGEDFFMAPPLWIDIQMGEEEEEEEFKEGDDKDEFSYRKSPYLFGLQKLNVIRYMPSLLGEERDEDLPRLSYLR
ncbi:beta strand repeat-containing protein [Thermodesulfobacteriota bacterium]